MKKQINSNLRIREFFRIYMGFKLHFTSSNYVFNIEMGVKGLRDMWIRCKTKKYFNIISNKVKLKDFGYFCISSFVFDSKMYITDMIKSDNLKRFRKFKRWHANKEQSYKSDLYFLLEKYSSVFLMADNINSGFKNIICFFVGEYKSELIGFETICYIRILYPKTTDSIDDWESIIFLIDKYLMLLDINFKEVKKLTMAVVKEYYDRRF